MLVREPVVNSSSTTSVLIDTFFTAPTKQQEFRVKTAQYAKTPIILVASDNPESSLEDLATRLGRELVRLDIAIRPQVILLQDLMQRSDAAYYAPRLRTIQEGDKTQVLAFAEIASAENYPRPYSLLAAYKQADEDRGLFIGDVSRELNLSDPEKTNLVICVGHSSNLFPIAEALRSHFPGLPVLALKTTKVENTLTSATFLPVELGSSSEIRTATVSSCDLDGQILKARVSSALDAQQRLRVIDTTKIPSFCPVVAEAIIKKLLPAVNEAGADIIFTGGVAIKALLNEVAGVPVPAIDSQSSEPNMSYGRPLSRDADFYLYEIGGRRGFDKGVQIMQSISTIPVSIFAPPGRDQYEPRSTKVSGQMQLKIEGPAVHVDWNPVRRITNGPWCFAFKLDRIAMARCCYAKFEHEGQSQVVKIEPPELLLLKKLTAQRNSDVKSGEPKFDLWDAAGILTKWDCDFTFIQRIIERQVHLPQLDEPTRDEFIANVHSQHFSALGIYNPTAISTISHRIQRTGIDQFIRECGSPDTVKKMALVSHLLTALEQLTMTADIKNQNLDFPLSIEEYWGKGWIANAQTLKRFLVDYLSQTVGISTSVIRRSHKSTRRIMDFFK